MRQNNSDEIKNCLLKNKNLAMILYVLSQIPSHTQELTGELNLSKTTVTGVIRYLRDRKLIKVLDINSIRNSKNGDLYPLILKKLKKIKSHLSVDEAKSVLKGLKFYFISHRGIIFLPFIQEILFRPCCKSQAWII